MSTERMYLDRFCSQAFVIALLVVICLLADATAKLLDRIAGALQ